jgi:hypothetical protein
MTATPLDATSIAADQDPCPSCGARLGGRTGCQAFHDELTAQAWTSPGRAAVHNLAVDTYAMQHPDDYCRSPKSYAAHLIGLCCGLEHPDDQALYWAIPRWLNGPAALERPPIVPNRGDMTIADVRAPRGEEEYPERIRSWAREVWAAYAVQQALARRWLEAVRLHKMQSGARVKR